MTTVEDVQQETVLYLSGALRAPFNGEEMSRRVEALLRDGARHIVLNLGEVSDVDAAGLGRLVHARNLAQAADGDLRITDAGEHTWTLLARTGLVDVLHASRRGPMSGDESETC